MKVCINCRTEYKENGLIECPNCKTKLLKKYNILAIVSFILSLSFHVILLLDIIFTDIPLVIYLLSMLLELIALIIGIIALALKKNYVYNHEWASITGIVMTILIVFFIIPRLIKPVEEHHPDESLNTTIQMNWSQQQNY